MSDRRPRFRPHLPLVLAVLAALVPPMSPPAAHAATFTNMTPMTIASSGQASPYPSEISVSGVTGIVRHLVVTIHGLSHTCPDDLDVLLVRPFADKAMLMSDVGGCLGANALNNVTLIFDDGANGSLPDGGPITSGRFKPTDIGANDAFPTPAPAGPYGTRLPDFELEDPNGTWRLFVVDDQAGEIGVIFANFRLALTVDVSPIISEIPDQATPEDTPVGPLPFTIRDVDTGVGRLTVSATSSNPALVPDANIALGGVGASRTVTTTPVDQSGTATITVSVSDGSTTTSDSFLLTVNLVNDSPTISDVTDRTIDEDTGTGPVPFTVGDPDGTDGLTLQAFSSDTLLMPPGGIVFGGSGADRTVTVTPAADRGGWGRSRSRSATGRPACPTASS